MIELIETKQRETESAIDFSLEGVAHFCLPLEIHLTGVGTRVSQYLHARLVKDSDGSDVRGFQRLMH